MLTFEIKKSIDERTDRLVEKAKEIVDWRWDKKNRRGEVIRPNVDIYSEVDKAQIRNILDMSMQSDSIEALILFIEYQMGRGKIPREWGHELINKIEELGGDAKEIKEIEAAQKKDVHLELIRLFLGYMTRYFIYKKEKGEE